MDRLREYGERARIYGWTNQMPRRLMSHHLVIGKAGGAMVQEAIAARCPMIVNQVIPGQEEGNAELIETLDIGAVARNKKEVRELVEEGFTRKTRIYLPRSSMPGKSPIATISSRRWGSSACPTSPIVNSDFHKPKHIYSWKTILQCEKEPEAIKECIRKNERVSLTLYRGDAIAEAPRARPPMAELPAPATLPPKLAAARAVG
jgi:hypothetical protein